MPCPVSLGDCTTPLGFQAAGVHCGIRDRKDVALVASDRLAAAAGLFTTNLVKAAPVLVCQESVKAGRALAMLVNAGNANACTGEQGLRDAREMVALAEEALGGPVLIASTGVIGRSLPMEAVRAGIPLAVSGLGRHGLEAADAIMTTDAYRKTCAWRGEGWSIGGMAKGAGMIHPDMATTLCLLTTDAEVEPSVLQEALRAACQVSFNSITVDGDTSTNDCMLILANGASGRRPTPSELTEALTAVCQDLARKVVRDGEGATRVVELEVSGAVSEEAARQVARTICTSLLFKTMLAGAEPNWGRVLAAAGRAGVPFREDRVALWFEDVLVMQNGQGLDANLERAAQVLRKEELKMRLDLAQGEGRARMWTCDLNEAYVKLNGSYLT